MTALAKLLVGNLELELDQSYRWKSQSTDLANAANKIADFEDYDESDGNPVAWAVHQVQRVLGGSADFNIRPDDYDGQLIASDPRQGDADQYAQRQDPERYARLHDPQWKEEDHPRKPAGSSGGGQFTKGDGGSGQKRAKAGGEYGANGEWYKGGAFIATRDLPKKQRDKRKKIAARKVMIEPGKWLQPEPGMVAIAQLLDPLYKWNEDELNEQAVAYYGANQNEGWHRDLRDAAKLYAAGERWADPNEVPELLTWGDVVRLAEEGEDIPGVALDRWEDHTDFDILGVDRSTGLDHNTPTPEEAEEYRDWVEIWTGEEFEARQSERWSDGPPFQQPKKTVRPKPEETLTPEQATAKLDEWKAAAKAAGEQQDNSNRVIFSLFDRTGEWSKPWVEAGYTVIQYDQQLGDDLMDYFPISDLMHVFDSGADVYGVIAAPPCTTMASSGARWWKDRHDVANEADLERMFGEKALQSFESPLEYNKQLLANTELFVELAAPSGFYAAENPRGRMGQFMAHAGETKGGKKKPVKASLIFDPHHYGDPYTKETHLWGEFNTDLPTANVEPTEGSKMHKKSSADWSRSLTPEGFAYAFFMANHDKHAETPKPSPEAEQKRQKMLFSARRARYGAKWVTIGGRQEGDKQHADGTPVQIDEEGNILKGPAELQGRDLDELDQDKEGAGAAGDPRELWQQAKSQAPEGAIVLYKDEDGQYHAYGDDAADLSELLGVGDASEAEFYDKDLEEYLGELSQAGRHVMVATKGGTEREVEPAEPETVHPQPDAGGFDASGDDFDEFPDETGTEPEKTVEDVANFQPVWTRPDPPMNPDKPKAIKIKSKPYQVYTKDDGTWYIREKTKRGEKKKRWKKAEADLVDTIEQRLGLLGTGNEARLHQAIEGAIGRTFEESPEMYRAFLSDIDDAYRTVTSEIEDRNADLLALFATTQVAGGHSRGRFIQEVQKAGDINDLPVQYEAAIGAMSTAAADPERNIGWSIVKKASESEKIDDAESQVWDRLKQGGLEKSPARHWDIVLDRAWEMGRWQQALEHFDEGGTVEQIDDSSEQALPFSQRSALGKIAALVRYSRRHEGAA